MVKYRLLSLIPAQGITHGQELRTEYWVAH